MGLDGRGGLGLKTEAPGANTLLGPTGKGSGEVIFSLILNTSPVSVPETYSRSPQVFPCNQPDCEEKSLPLVVKVMFRGLHQGEHCGDLGLLLPQSLPVEFLPTVMRFPGDEGFQ